VFSPDVKVEKWARIEESVLFSGCRIGRNAVIRRAILDKNVVVPDGVEIGVDHDHDRARGFHVESGITVVAKNVVVPSNT
jgi:glucose-1-phosphate adenylyltransferase